jgi:hypothetical protein
MYLDLQCNPKTSTSCKHGRVPRYHHCTCTQRSADVKYKVQCFCTISLKAAVLPGLKKRTGPSEEEGGGGGGVVQCLLTFYVKLVTLGSPNLATEMFTVKSPSSNVDQETGYIVWLHGFKTSTRLLYAFFWVISGVWILCANVSEHSVCSIFTGG